MHEVPETPKHHRSDAWIIRCLVALNLILLVVVTIIVIVASDRLHGSDQALTRATLAQHVLREKVDVLSAELSALRTNQVPVASFDQNTSPAGVEINRLAEAKAISGKLANGLSGVVAVRPDHDSLPKIKAAIEAGDADVLYSLGLSCRYGISVPRSGEEALKLFAISASKGHEEARYEYASLLASEDAGILRDEARAYEIALDLAKSGHPSGQLSVAFSHKLGLAGKSVDLVEAYAWYNVLYANERAPDYVKKFNCIGSFRGGYVISDILALRESLGGRLNSVQLSQSRARSSELFGIIEARRSRK